jgi:hypothetical protein
MCVDLPVLPRSYLDLSYNEITSLAGVTFNFKDCE